VVGVISIPELDALIKKALEQNPNLGAADAALRAAQENVNAQIGGQYFPAVGLGAGAQSATPAIGSLWFAVWV
jgi:outer membrane protein TolC